ncbi:Trichothecene 3-O-acetyltransferase [Fusarium austroafricanum]|uniref:Trichothecene 3-O-acetyltransferase n=1 Tax=Fusarium austroafricanum TaxID=2364996 RepID=A0A8H4KD95_9HYPO|nr:Trichothecene 3-O-acetyltransferase [Fusarium austroafricanum]
MTGPRIISVKPLGSDPQAKDKILQLSDVDHLMPKLYVHVIEIFELPDDISKESIINNLASGLERTLADYLILTGTLQFDNETKRIVIKKQPDSSLNLCVKIAAPDDIPPFSVLDKHDFPVHLLDSPKVLPAQFVGANFPVPGCDISADGPAVGGAQITFIEGGVILGLAITHQVCDGPGFENIFTAWARYTTDSAKRDSLNGVTHSQSLIPSCSIFTLGSKPKLTVEEIEKLGAKFPVMKLRDGPLAPPPADFKMLIVKTRIWHFPKSKLQQLKSQCSVGLEPGSWISTYNAILSIMWRANVRAKSPLVKPDPNAPSKAVHAINGRGRTGFPISDRYIGTAITMPQSRDFTVSKVLSNFKITLPILAQAVRKSTNSVNPEYISDLVKHAARSSNLQQSELDMH